MTKKWTAKTAAIQTLKDKGVPMSIEGIYKYAVNKLPWRVGDKKPAIITMEIALKTGVKDGVFILPEEDLMFGLPKLKAKYKKKYLYVLQNPAMPGYLKVGSTGNLDERVETLSNSTSIPVPFQLIYVVKTPRALKLERRIQKAHSKHREGNKDFFKGIDLNNIKAIVEDDDDDIEIIKDIDRGIDVADETHTSDQSSGGPTRSKKVKKGFAGFSELNIPPGTELTLKGDPSITCQVSKKDPRNKKVRYEAAWKCLYQKRQALGQKSRTQVRYGLPGTLSTGNIRGKRSARLWIKNPLRNQEINLSINNSEQRRKTFYDPFRDLCLGESAAISTIVKTFQFFAFSSLLLGLFS